MSHYLNGDGTWVVEAYRLCREKNNYFELDKGKIMNNTKIYKTHEQACDYAKINPGFIVVINKNNWYVGERKTILAIKKEELSVTKKNHKSQTVKQQIHDQHSVGQNDDMFEDDNSAEEVESMIFWEEYYEDKDPDDWTRSNEEGWFYED